MNERLRVNLSIVLWVTLAFVVIVCGVYIIGNKDVARVAPVEATAEKYHPFDVVANDAMQYGGVEGMAVAYVDANGATSVCGYGSLAGDVVLTLDGLNTPIISIVTMRGVEQGRITLNEAVAIINEDVNELLSGTDVLNAIGMEATAMDDDATTTTIGDMSKLATVFLCDGEINGMTILSSCGVDALLTSAFGWSRPAAMSLLTDKAVEYCGDNWAIIVDREADVAVAIVVDEAESLDEELFEDIRSKCSSVARAVVSKK